MNDYISRANTLDALKQCKMHCIDPFDSYDIDAEDAEFAISRIPAADVAPVVHGEWIRGKYTDDDLRYNDWSYRCNKCGKHVDYEECFCPKCGAKMDGKEQVNDMG